MITFTTGDIFEAQTEAIVNTVNLMGVMGKGIALQFKERFKNNYKIYRSACEEHTIDIGKLLTVKAQWQGRDIFIINFPTKKHWRNPSEYSFVEAGLDDLVRVIEQYGIKSIAIPPLGAGNGKLDWKEVRRIISLKLSDVDCDIQIYEPGHEARSADKDVRLTPARAMLLMMLNKVQTEGFDATAFAAVKVAYFLQKFGATDYFRLKFVPHIYGPYNDAVAHMLHGLDGAFIRGFADMDKKPFEPFDLEKSKLHQVEEFVNNDIILSSIVDECARFLDGYYDDFSLELLSSVDYLMAQRPDADSTEIHDLLMNWNSRKKRLFADPVYTNEAYRHIRAFGS